MNLDQLRLEYLTTDHQFILLDDDGLIIESCNSLVDASDYYQKSIYDIIPFLESFRLEIENLEPQNPLSYECINMTFIERNSVYDFLFKKVHDNVMLILIDGEKKYAILKVIQQERNESVITKEIKEKEARMKSSFLANMSHEIRTPMNIVTGYSNLLLASKDLSKENREFANNISIAAKNLLVLINDILDLSKIEAGYLKIEKITFDLRRSVNNLTKIFQNQSSDGNITFQTIFGSQVPEIIISDPVRINQILTNLLSNALKFTDKGGTITLDINIDKEASTLIFKVIDTGIGIDADKLDKIFESFTQEEDSTTRKFGGTGLGLSIVKKLSDLLDGSIHLDSIKGKGSTFTVTIPFKEGIKEELEEHQELQSYDATFLENKKILIAEDNRMNRMLIVKILGDANCHLTLAVNGQEAVEFASKQEFDVILMDVQMPILDGLQATKQILANPTINMQTPIIAMTAHTFEEDIKRCYDAGMVGYISKPFKLDDLFSVIVDQIKRSKEDEAVHHQMKAKKEEVTTDLGGIQLDFRFLEQLAGGNKAFVKEFFEIYIEEVSAAVQEMKAPIDQAHTTVVKQAVHQIKPTLEMIGLFDIKKQIEAFEQSEITVENTEQLIQSIQPTIENSIMIIAKMLDQEEIEI